MTTITLNCTDIAWVEAEEKSILVCCYTADGEKAIVETNDVACETYTACENFFYLVEQIEDIVGHDLFDDDLDYLYTKLRSTIDKWSYEGDYLNDLQRIKENGYWTKA